MNESSEGASGVFHLNRRAEFRNRRGNVHACVAMFCVTETTMATLRVDHATRPFRQPIGPDLR